jgi:hypothetical protein
MGSQRTKGNFVLDELGKETKVKSAKFEDFVDLRALRELEKEGFLNKCAVTRAVHSGSMTAASSRMTSS